MNSLVSFLRSILSNYDMSFVISYYDLDSCDFAVSSVHGDIIFRLACVAGDVVLYFNVPGSYSFRVSIPAEQFVQSYFDVVSDFLSYFALHAKNPLSRSVLARCISNLHSTCMLEILT